MTGVDCMSPATMCYKLESYSPMMPIVDSGGQCAECDQHFDSATFKGMADIGQKTS
jgi:hypothetical protein